MQQKHQNEATFSFQTNNKAGYKFKAFQICLFGTKIHKVWTLYKQCNFPLAQKWGFLQRCTIWIGKKRGVPIRSGGWKIPWKKINVVCLIVPWWVDFWGKKNNRGATRIRTSRVL